MAERKRLTEKDDFRDVYNALYEASTKWRKIGIQLGIPISKLNQIESKVGNDDDKGLQELLSIWLKLTSLDPTWHSLVAALRHPTVGEEASAEDIEEKYMTTPPQKRQKMDEEMCPKHDKPLRLFCESCQTVICDDCIIREHKSHDHDVAADTFERYTKELTDNLEAAEEQLKTVGEALDALRKRKEHIKEHEETIEREIEVKINLLRKALDDREKQLIQQAKDTAQKQMATLDKQTDEVTNVHDKIRDWSEEVKAGLTKSPQEVLVMKELKIQQKQENDDKLRSVNLDPKEKATTKLVVDDLEQRCRDYGIVIGEDQTVDPTRCYVTKEAAVTLQTLDTQGKTIFVPTAEISAELVQFGQDTPVGCEVTMKDKGKYTVAYTPTVRGRHQLRIKVGQTPIGPSPIPVMGRLLCETLSQRQGKSVAIIPKSNCNLFQRIAMNRKGQLLVEESQQGCINVFTPEPYGLPAQYKLQHTISLPEDISTMMQRTTLSTGPIGMQGSRRGPLYGSYMTVRLRGLAFLSICTDDDNNIFVVCRGKQHIWTSTPDGMLVPHSDSLPEGCVTSSIVYNRKSRKIYICDNKNQQVEIFTTNLEHAGRIPCKEVEQPSRLAVDSQGMLYITDDAFSHNNARVFTTEGELVRSLELKVTLIGGPDRLRPTEIHIDSNDKLYALGKLSHLSSVSIFTTKGQFLKTIGEGSLSEPVGLTVDDEGYIYVSDIGGIVVF